jgi:hypothetical protein
VAGHRAAGGAPAAIHWPEWEDDLPGNVLGFARAFTAFAPMPWWAVLLLHVKLTWVKLLPNTALRAHHFVYFGRWTLLPRLPGTGRKGDRYVLIETNFNGSFAEYLDTLAAVLSKNLNAIWGRCYGCPPKMQPPSEFRRWGRMHELAAAHYFCAYPEATVKQIEMALVRQSGGSPEEAQTAIRVMPHLTVLQRLRGALGRLRRPSEVAPVGAHPGVMRDNTLVSAVSVLTPVQPDRLETLRNYLTKLAGEAFDVAGTHVARLVVVDELVNEKVSADPLPVEPPLLLFGAVGEGEPREYLDRLCGALPAEVRRIWTDHCSGAGESSLAGFLWENRLHDGLLYGGYKATTAGVRTALAEHPDPGPA